MTVKVAALQMVSTDCWSQNRLVLEKLLKQAKQQKVDLILLPENFSLMASSAQQRLEHAKNVQQEIIDWLKHQASENHLWIFAGSMPTTSPESERFFATMWAISNKGEMVARYDKIHLFDVEAGGENYCESSYIFPGHPSPCVVETPWGNIGLSICYDLRFPELYRHFAKENCFLVLNAAAFTQATGKKHWQVLLQARAIENQCYVLAAGQAGVHADGRETWGQSMAIDFDGNILAQQAKGEGLVVAAIEPGELQHHRERFPVLQHRKIDS